MEYAKTLVPAYVMRKVGVVGNALSQQVLPLVPARPFKVATHNRFQKKGVMATSLDDLREKTARAFLLTYQFLTIVLEEDGTLVDTEAFFQSLPPNTQLIVLERGQIWTQDQCVLGAKKLRKNETAKLTFHLYKLHPKDFLGCLTIKARLYEMYTLSYDLKCLGPKCVLMAFLRCLVYAASMAGHLLLCGSSYLLQFIGEGGY